EMLDDLLAPLRGGLDLAVEVAEEDGALLAADAFVVALEIFFRVPLPQLLEHVDGQLAQEELIVARDLQAGHELVEGRVPDVAFAGRYLPAGEEDDVSAGGDPAMAALAILGNVGSEVEAMDARRAVP